MIKHKRFYLPEAFNFGGINMAFDYISSMFQRTTSDVINGLGDKSAVCLVADLDNKAFIIEELYKETAEDGRVYWVDNNYNTIANLWTPTLKTSESLGNIAVIGCTLGHSKQFSWDVLKKCYSNIK